jgi:hypothetical protein
MDTKFLVKLAKVNSALENKGYFKESDQVRTTLVRLAYYFQSPYMNIPVDDRVIPYTQLDPYLDDLDLERQNFDRYRENEDIFSFIDWDVDENGDLVEFQSLEVSLHPEESNPSGGIKNYWFDGASSIFQGKNWGRSEKERDQNNAAGLRYLNLVPNNSF